MPKDSPPVSSMVTTPEPHARPHPRPKFPTPEPERSSRPESQEDDLVGKVLDNRYLIIKRIGEGGMGHIYLATNKNMPGRMFAIKVLRKDHSFFQKEAMAVQKIGHDGIVKVYDYGVIEDGKKDRPYLVMEYLEGVDVGGLLEKKKRLSWPVARDITLQVCAALQAAHENGVIHLDMKPQNVFLSDPEGKDSVKVLDFGIAWLPESVAGIESSSAKGFVGTAAYAPPEQSRGSKECDHRSDIYAVGVMLYEMLCGSLPFVSTSVRETRLMHAECAPPPFSTYGQTSGIPDGVEAVVMRCLEKTKEGRYQSMTEFAQALLAADQKSRQLLDMPDVLQEDDHERPPRNRMESSSFVGWIAAALIGVAAAWGIWAHSKGSGDAPVELRQDAQPALAETPDASAERPPEKKEQPKKPHKPHRAHRSNAGSHPEAQPSQNEGHPPANQAKTLLGQPVDDSAEEGYSPE